jgi:hypothetical protein
MDIANLENDLMNFALMKKNVKTIFMPKICMQHYAIIGSLRIQRNGLALGEWLEE